MDLLQNNNPILDPIGRAANGEIDPGFSAWSECKDIQKTRGLSMRRVWVGRNGEDYVPRRLLLRAPATGQACHFPTFASRSLPACGESMEERRLRWLEFVAWGCGLGLCSSVTECILRNVYDGVALHLQGKWSVGSAFGIKSFIFVLGRVSFLMNVCVTIFRNESLFGLVSHRAKTCRGPNVILPMSALNSAGMNTCSCQLLAVERYWSPAAICG